RPLGCTERGMGDVPPRVSLAPCPSLLQESVEMATREEGQEHLHERMAPMRPEEGETPPHADDIDEHGKKDHGDAEHTGITPPVHGLSRSYGIVVAEFFPGDTGIRTTFLHVTRDAHTLEGSAWPRPPWLRNRRFPSGLEPARA